jgi:dTDP-4-amino-4,6-dideoxy-D-galactose acyltransferase
MDEPCQFLEWDSHFFGVPTARVIGDTLTPERARQIDEWCASRGVRWLYLLARADDDQTVSAAERTGFHLTDVRVTLERPTEAAGPVPDAPGVRPFRAEDLEAVRRIARGAYADSRFYYDPRVPREKCDELFVLWTVQSCAGASTAVWVAEEAGDVAGYVACDVKGSWGSIGLIGVSSSARGKGVGTALVEAAIAWAARAGLAGLTVVTQARNVPAQRLYQRRGFVTRSVGLYYHKWYD